MSAQRKQPALELLRLLAALLVCKGMLGGWIESAMAGFPPQAMADQFAAKTP